MCIARVGVNLRSRRRTLLTVVRIHCGAGALDRLDVAVPDGLVVKFRGIAALQWGCSVALCCTIFLASEDVIFSLTDVRNGTVLSLEKAATKLLLLGFEDSL